MKLYASIIQRLEKELNIEVNDFPELRLYACDLEEKQSGVNHIGYIMLLLIDGVRINNFFCRMCLSGAEIVESF